MGRSPCCSKEGLNRGAWTSLEDKILTAYINAHGEGNWRNLPKRAGLKRCGKSCRLRWLNYLRPDIKRGNISDDEEDLIIRLHKLLGNRWSLIAGRLPGRTDNEIKNYWNTTIAKKLGGQKPPKRSKRKNKNKSKPKPIIEAAQPQPPSVVLPLLGPTSGAANQQQQAIRTKASRCTKVVLEVDGPGLGQDCQSKTDHHVGCVPGGQEGVANGLSNLMILNSYSQLEQFNEQMGDGWMGNISCCLEEGATFDLDSLAFSLDEWAS